MNKVFYTGLPGKNETDALLRTVSIFKKLHFKLKPYIYVVMVQNNCLRIINHLLQTFCIITFEEFNDE